MRHDFYQLILSQMLFIYTFKIFSEIEYKTHFGYSSQRQSSANFHQRCAVSAGAAACLGAVFWAR